MCRNYRLLLVVMCCGCVDTAQDRQDAEVRRDAAVQELKELGESMHADHALQEELQESEADVEGMVTSKEVEAAE